MGAAANCAKVEGKGKCPQGKEKGCQSAEGKVTMPKTSKPAPARWSQRVTETSNALDLEPKIFLAKSPRRIAASLKRSAEQSNRHKGTKFQSAMSMLNFYINRAGKGLPPERKRVLTDAKAELRRIFGRGPER